MAKKVKRLSTHHRKPRSVGGSSDEINLSKVKANQHQAWHTLFFNYTAEEICEIINETWLDPDYMFICKKRD